VSATQRKGRNEDYPRASKKRRPSEHRAARDAGFAREGASFCAPHLRPLRSQLDTCYRIPQNRRVYSFRHPSEVRFDMPAPIPPREELR
jgi:hypothetical protein